MRKITRVEKDPARRWLDAVINHPASDLTLVLLEILSAQGKDEKYIVAVTERLAKLLEDDNNFANRRSDLC